MALSTAPKRPAEILLVEDSLPDAILTEKALRTGPVPFNLHRVETGEEALDYLRNGNWPDVILLDLNLPGMHGQEVLEEIKQHPFWRRIRVIVLTSSKQESDLLSSLDVHCDAYMTKPGDQRVFMRMADQFEQFWFQATRLAPR